MSYQILVSGLVLGSLYAIVALGYTMVYGIIELINFAHGDVFIFGAFIAIPTIAGTTVFGWHWPGLIPEFTSPTVAQSIVAIGVAMIVAAAFCAVLGVAIERIAYRRLRNSPRLAPLITAIGMSLILENLMFQWQGGGFVAFPDPLTPWAWNFTLNGQQVTITNIQLLVFFGALVLMVMLDLFVNRTNTGKAMRAVAQDREAASMMGINVNRIISLTFAVGSALAGAGAVLYGMDVLSIGFDSGFALGLFAFTAAVLGGIGNIRGAVLGGFFIGIVTAYMDNLGAGLGSGWYDTVIFSILVLVLVFRPAGILGTNTAEKV